MAGLRSVGEIVRFIGKHSGSVSPRIRPVIVGVLAAAEVFLRTLADLFLRVLDDEVIPALVSVVTEGFLESGLITVLLFGYLLFVLIPLVFPIGLTQVVDRRGFRILAAGSVVLIPFALFQWGSPALPVLGWLGPALLACPVVLPAYVVLVQRQKLLGRESYVIGFANAFFPTVELRTDIDDGSDSEQRSLRFWATFGGFSVIAFGYAYILFLILGLLLVFLSLMAPIPELLLLGWAGYRVVANSSDQVQSDTTGVRFDLEQRIVSLTGVATNGFKGAMCVLIAGTGFVFPVLFVNIAVQIAVGSAGSAGVVIDQLTRSSSVELLRFLVAIITILTAGSYGVWYWLRLLSRVPHFYDVWLDALPDDLETPPDREYGPLLARPPGYYLPPIALLVLFSLLIHSGSATILPRDLRVVIVAWVGALGLTIWSAYRGALGDPQSALSDQMALPGSFLVQMAGTWLWLGIADGGILLQVLFGQASLRRLLEMTLQSPGGQVGVGFTVASLYLFYLMDVLHWQGAGGWRGSAYLPYLLAGAALLGLTAMWTSGFLRALTGVAAFVLVVVTVGLNLAGADRRVDLDGGG